MFKFAVVIFALLAVAAAQFIASPYAAPYAYSGLYRSGVVGAYPAVTTYSAAGYPAAYTAGYGYNGLLYK